jgi:hypothetical protein
MLIAREGRCRYSAYSRGGGGDVWQMKGLMTLVLGLLLAGCAVGQGDGADSTIAEEETTAHSVREETTVLTGGDLPRPPKSTLSYGGREVKGTLGTYCWGDGGTQVCADTAFIVPPRKKTLTVSSGSEVVFRYGGQRPPKKVGARASPLSKNDTSSASANLNRSRSLKAHGSGVERTIPAELPPGEYVVDVHVTEPQGGASYFFRVMVE